MRIVLESIRRIAEYGSDIAEMVLNLLADKEMSIQDLRNLAKQRKT